jgi:hypothetical protein
MKDTLEPLRGKPGFVRIHSDHAGCHSVDVDRVLKVQPFGGEDRARIVIRGRQDIVLHLDPQEICEVFLEAERLKEEAGALTPTSQLDLLPSVESDGSNE